MEASKDLRAGPLLLVEVRGSTGAGTIYVSIDEIEGFMMKDNILFFYYFYNGARYLTEITRLLNPFVCVDLIDELEISVQMIEVNRGKELLDFGVDSRVIERARVLHDLRFSKDTILRHEGDSGGPLLEAFPKVGNPFTLRVPFGLSPNTAYNQACRDVGFFFPRAKRARLELNDDVVGRKALLSYVTYVSAIRTYATVMATGMRETTVFQPLLRESKGDLAQSWEEWSARDPFNMHRLGTSTITTGQDEHVPLSDPCYCLACTLRNEKLRGAPNPICTCGYCTRSRVEALAVYEEYDGHEVENLYEVSTDAASVVASPTQVFPPLPISPIHETYESAVTPAPAAEGDVTPPGAPGRVLISRVARALIFD